MVVTNELFDRRPRSELSVEITFRFVAFCRICPINRKDRARQQRDRCEKYMHADAGAEPPPFRNCGSSFCHTRIN